MSQINFNYKGEKIIIQCQKDEKMKDIIQRFLVKTNTDINSVYFLYAGNSNINSELTFSEIANDIDKIENSMNIIVHEIDSNIQNKSYIKSKDILYVLNVMKLLK